jgi:photosystem II stability/assembly factor-like uncharacterized protein
MKYVKKYPRKIFLNRFVITCLLPVFMLAGCGTTDSGELITLKGSWNAINLQEDEVNVTGSSDNKLYYVSGNKFYQLTVEGLNFSQNELLFETEVAVIADFIIKNNGNILLGIRYDDFESEEPRLFESSDEGNNWEISSKTVPEEVNHFVIRHIEKIVDSTDSLIAYVGRIVVSNDGGSKWDVIFEEGGFSSFIYTDNFHPNQIWNGGDTEIMSPGLARSIDRGENWVLLNNNINFGSDAVVRDVILHHQNSDWVLAGLGGSFAPSNVVRKSTDGGESWETVLEETGIHTFARSLQNPNLIYASGRDTSTKLFFAWTTDFGETWEKQIFEEGPDIVTTNDMEVMIIDGKEVIFFGTDKGLFSFSVTP